MNAPKPRILVVDDDEMVRFVVRAVLEPAGYQIVEAENGQEGVEKFAGPEGPFSLVLMDISMPGMNGPEALRRIREKAPDTRLVLLSGSPEQPAEAGNLPGVTFFSKPFLNDELLSLVRRELSLPAPSPAAMARSGQVLGQQTGH
jgi:CheY-like chemotaxis protein